MHEFSICQTLVKATLAELKKHPTARLKKARVVVGQQHAIVPENLQFAYETLVQSTPAEGSALDIQVRPVTARCRRCGWTESIGGIHYVCGACAAGDIELTGGNELYLDSLEVETDEPADD